MNREIELLLAIMGWRKVQNGWLTAGDELLTEKQVLDRFRRS